MKAIRSLFLVCLVVLGTSACSIRHVIEEDFPEYLAKNSGESNLPQTDKASTYFLTPNTQSHSYEFRAITTGYANLWVVDFGKMLDDSLMSADVQNAFGSLQKLTVDSGNAWGLLIFDLQHYAFEDFAAHVTLDVSLTRSGQKVFSRTYKESGKSQGGKMLLAGAFGQKNAVQQSTKLALDEILRQLIADLNGL